VLRIAYTDLVTPADTARPVQRTWLCATIAIAAALQLLVVNFWPSFESPSERGRIYQALAVVNRGRLDIGPEVERFGGMEDLASARGRLFSDKAPGMLPLLLPGAALARALSGSDPVNELRLALVLGRLLAGSLPFALCVVLLARATSTRFPRGAPVAVAAYALATPALAASLLLFSHALTACLLLAGFVLLFASSRPRWPAAMLAGALLAWAATCEYPTSVPAAVLAIGALRRLGLRRVLAFSVGGVVPLVLLGAYNVACFASPFALGTAHEAYGPFADMARQGLFGVSWPTVGGLGGLLFSSGRGLLVWIPLVLLAAFAAVARPPWPERPGARFALAAAPVALLLVISGAPNWRGGWFPGPRYLLAVLPLVLVLVARGVENLVGHASGRVLVAVAALWGWLQVWPVVASFPFPPEDYALPFATLARPLLAEGISVPSWLPRALEVPVLALLAAAAAVLLFVLATRGARPFERVVAIGVFLVMLVLALGVRPPATWRASLERAVIHDVYAGGPRGALEALAPRADTPARRATLEGWIARRDRP
jgi:hypothetical protein